MVKIKLILNSIHSNFVMPYAINGKKIMKNRISWIVAVLVLLGCKEANSQELIEVKPWVSIGPNEPPSSPNYRDDTGIGPVEFIRVYPKKEGHLLAGSLSGGLFYSNDGGDLWQTCGSDEWAYTGCAWADFYPEDEQIWFACSNFSGENGKPGRIGTEGGLMRSMNGGHSWELIGDYKDFIGSPQLVIYGTRFHPANPTVLFVLTSDGLYYTENCLKNVIQWTRVPNVNGLTYDLDFVGEEIFVSNYFQDKWSILVFNIDVYDQFTKVKPFEQESRVMRNVTFEPQSDQLLIAKDFLKETDEVCVLNKSKDTLEVLLKKQQIGFGSGYTFAVSPYNPDEFYIGQSTRIKKQLPPYTKLVPIGFRYHVDVEFVAYDPFDSLKVYLATHGGVFISKNAGTDWENKSLNLGISEVMGMAVSRHDPNQIVIGCYHDGSMVRADFEKNGSYSWRAVNGGDGLLPLVDPTNNAVVYTSNQYNGGGLYFSSDTAKNEKINIHNLNNLKTAGWETAVVMDYNQPQVIFFNYMEAAGFNKGNINVCRTRNAKENNSAEILSDFNASHQMQSYKVYGLFNSAYHPNVLIAYVLDYVTDEQGNKKTNHRLFRTDIAHGNSLDVKKSWCELEHPNNSWIADIEIDAYHEHFIYLSYGIGKENPESIFGDRGMLYQLRYSSSNKHALKRQIDISKNIPSGVAGRYNLAYSKKNGGTLFIATVSGVYAGTNRSLKGKSRWQSIGVALPHCKVYSLDFNEKHNVLTVGLFGRGVWQYYF